VSRDANQIAQEHERRQRYAGDQRVDHRAIEGTPAASNFGTLTIWRDGNPAERESEKMSDVAVQIHPSGWLIVVADDGSKTLLYPEPGWYVDFLPNHAGE
jgi:hypothetical protein